MRQRPDTVPLAQLAEQSPLEQFRRLASSAPEFDGKVPAAVIRQALLIREVEQTFLRLFAQGRMNGTVHTCVGQEFSAVAVAGQLEAHDWVSSNHRCHGHFIAKTGNWQALVDELMGLKSGVCMGVGSSQHLFASGFLSNGPQAALLPVGTGIALHHSKSGSAAICVSFIGEGTMGEGVLYEALNLAALWQVPQLFVCENNLYSQSTPQASAMAGTLRGRAEAFGIRYFEGDTWNVTALLNTAQQAIDYVRTHGAPAFLTVRTYRLNAHSKGDDDRDPAEIAFFSERDPLNRLLAHNASWRAEQAALSAELTGYTSAPTEQILTEQEYVKDQLPRVPGALQTELANEKLRMHAALNRAYRAVLARGSYMIGEDITDPYGGAFKVTKGLSSEFPSRVLGTPISEAGIAGVGIGLALMGTPTYVEIMFGDFTTLVFDQLVNNASKFFHMYGFQASAPVRIRTPMGGKRGYGPTHSQSLEKYLVGIDNIAVFAFTSLVDPGQAIAAIDELPMPAVLVENKIDYGRVLWQGSDDHRAVQQGGALGTLVISPLQREPTVTVVSYGETAREIAEQLTEIFVVTDHVAELLVPVTLHPLDMGPILDSALRTRHVVVVENGSVAFGIGAEVLAQLAESQPGLTVRRVGAEPVPIPSVLSLEKALLPSARKLMAALLAPASEAHP